MMILYFILFIYLVSSSGSWLFISLSYFSLGLPDNISVKTRVEAKCPQVCLGLYLRVSTGEGAAPRSSCAADTFCFHKLAMRLGFLESICTL